jgi:nucleotide-binding universal stress UspA family protein
MASHGYKGLAAVWHSSQTREVLTHSTVPTLVYR